MEYTVGQMAKLLGVAPSTLRYYDKQGLLPGLARSEGGVRAFGDRDYETLKLIQCLKRAGMSLADIRRFIDMTAQGDSTIDQRLALFYRQREAVQQQMAHLQQTLAASEYKCWYYETAKAAGTTAALAGVEIPPQFRQVWQQLHQPEEP